jgi:hypothetical protein
MSLRMLWSARCCDLKGGKHNRLDSRGPIVRTTDAPLACFQIFAFRQMMVAGQIQ